MTSKKKTTAKTRTPNPEQPEKRRPGRPRGGVKWKQVSFSVNPEEDYTDKIRYIAHYDRKPIGVVVEEAFKAYIASWKPSEEQPKQL